MAYIRTVAASLCFASVVGCATSAALRIAQFDSAKGDAAALALDGRFDQAGRHLAAFGDRLPPGSFYRAIALLNAADYYAAGESRGAAIAALNRCLDGTPESDVASRAQQQCRIKRQSFSGGAFTSAAQARAMAESEMRYLANVARMEAEDEGRRPAPAFVPPALAMNPGGPRPPPPPALAPRRELFDASSCLSLERNSSTNFIGLRNRCSHTVDFTFCTLGDPRNSYACEGVPPTDLGGGVRSFGRGSMSVGPGGHQPIIPYDRSTGALWMGCAARDGGGSVLPFLTSVRPPQGICR